MKTDPFFGYGIACLSLLTSGKFVSEYEFESISPWDPFLPGPLPFSDLSCSAQGRGLHLYGRSSLRLTCVLPDKNEIFNSRHSINLDVTGIYCKTELPLW